MSEDLRIDHEIKWEDEVDEITEAPPMRVFKEFGAFQYIGNKKVQLFQSGERVEFPNFLFNGQPYSRGGMKEGHAKVAPGKKNNNAIAHFIAWYGKKFSNDEDFAHVQVFTNNPQIPVAANKVDNYPVIALDDYQQEKKQAGETVWLADWSNLQYPALRTDLNDKQKKAFSDGERLYYEASLWNTGAKPREDNQGRLDDDGNPQKYYDRYRFNFTIYDTEAAMLAAREQYKKENASETGASDDFWPETWVASNSVEKMVEYAKGLSGSHAEIATALMLNDATAANGDKVNVALVLSKCLDVPEPMIQL